jgi:hypothetical protein
VIHTSKVLPGLKESHIVSQSKKWNLTLSTKECKGRDKGVDIPEKLEYHPQLLNSYINGTERTTFLYPRF